MTFKVETYFLTHKTLQSSGISETIRIFSGWFLFWGGSLVVPGETSLSHIMKNKVRYRKR